MVLLVGYRLCKSGKAERILCFRRFPTPMRGKATGRRALLGNGDKGGVVPLPSP